MATLVFDCETHADLSSLSEPDVLTLAEAAVKREMDTAAYVATCPAMARVAMVGMLTPENDKRLVYYDRLLVDIPILNSVDAAVIACDGESALLVEVHRFIAAHQTLVGFNSLGFDVPLLILRAWRYGITPAPVLLASAKQKPWESRPHIDVLNVLTFGDRRNRYSLATYALGLGVANPKQGGDGGHVGDLIAERNGTDLARYCLGDVEATAALAIKSGAITLNRKQEAA